ncbi:MAG TPA: CDP-archaeol synthase, partial [Candidatus Bathyarchaeota archaeon]|nr:CDP-archaeol synthase [Candidatus Bathyarchaeota archaeon]
TIRGCAVGMLAGALVGVAQGWPTVGVVQGVGAILGDLMSSFVKRRLDLEPGASAPLLDQLDFIVVAALLSQPLTKASHQDLATIILLTVPIHYLANFFSWLFKVKDRPW